MDRDELYLEATRISLGDRAYLPNSSSSYLPFRLVIRAVITVFLLVAPCFGIESDWMSPNKHRLLLRVDSRGIVRTNCPASVDIDFAFVFSEDGIAGTFDEHTIELMALDSAGCPKVFDRSRGGYERYLVPWRLDKYYGISRVTLNFVIPDETCKTIAVYFDTLESGLGNPQRYPGLVGDGDFFRQH